MMHEWENLGKHWEGTVSYGRSWRMEVPGGWIYRHSEYGMDEAPAVAVVFVPRPASGRRGKETGQ